MLSNFFLKLINLPRKYKISIILLQDILNPEINYSSILYDELNGDETTQPFSYLDPSHEKWHMHSTMKK